MSKRKKGSIERFGDIGKNSYITSKKIKDLKEPKKK